MLVLALSLALTPAGDKKAEYAKPRLLMEPALMMALLPERVVVLDARPREDYDKGHVPGARWVDVAAWSKAVLADEDVEKWAERIGALGIDGKLSVVVYDDDRSREASRLWWILKFWGVPDVRVLNGGWKGFLAAGGKPTTETPAVTPRRPELKREEQRLATRERIEKLLKRGASDQLLDARSEGEHCGDKKLAKRGGAIPGARHLEWSDMIERKSGRFKSAAELTKLFRDAGIDLDQPTTTYCQSGGRAAVAAFVYELMTGKPARNYYKSWAEWGNAADTPVETPRRKK
jgi:thiosulfate/3-mercaptopyruvate sulfurtransferase